MSVTSNGAPAPQSPRTIHDAVVACFDALVVVYELVYPTESNLCECRGLVEAQTRLNCLHDTLTMFPLRRIEPDPFVAHGAVRSPLPIGGSVTGSSAHDALLRHIWCVYDSLGVAETRVFTDPKMGESFEGF